MSLDVDTPPPPKLKDEREIEEYDDVEVVGRGDYRRDELATFLESGAWESAFQQWAASTTVTESQFQIAADLELFDEFDFFWDDHADRVGYHAPGIPEDWQQRNLHPALESWETASAINAGLTEFGQLVCEVLADKYVDWESEFEAPDDLPDF